MTIIPPHNILVLLLHTCLVSTVGVSQYGSSRFPRHVEPRVGACHCHKMRLSTEHTHTPYTLFCHCIFIKIKQPVIVFVPVLCTEYCSIGLYKSNYRSRHHDSRRAARRVVHIGRGRDGKRWGIGDVDSWWTAQVTTCVQVEANQRALGEMYIQ